MKESRIAGDYRGACPAAHHVLITIADLMPGYTP
jgi:hypothetical protein